MFYSGTDGVCVVSPLVNHHLSRGAHFMVGLLVPPVSQSLLKKNWKKTTANRRRTSEPTWISASGGPGGGAGAVVRQNICMLFPNKLLQNAPSAAWRGRRRVRILELLQKIPQSTLWPMSTGEIKRIFLMRSQRYADMSAGILGGGEDNRSTSQCGTVCRCGEELPPLPPHSLPSLPQLMREAGAFHTGRNDLDFTIPCLISAVFSLEQRKHLREQLTAHKHQAKWEANSPTGSFF